MVRRAGHFRFPEFHFKHVVRALLATLGEFADGFQYYSQLVSSDAKYEVVQAFGISITSCGKPPHSGEFVIIVGPARGENEIAISDDDGNGSLDAHFS